MMLPIGLTGIPLAGNWACLGRAVAKTKYLEVIAKSTYHRSRGILPQREEVIGTCARRHIPRHFPAISNEVKTYLRTQSSRLRAEGTGIGLTE